MLLGGPCRCMPARQDTTLWPLLDSHATVAAWVAVFTVCYTTVMTAALPTHGMLVEQSCEQLLHDVCAARTLQMFFCPPTPMG